MPERKSSTHNPRVDEQMGHEVAPVVQGEPVESHSREDLQQEGPVGRPGYRPDGGANPAGFSDETVELRSAVATSLRPSAFPADRDSLLTIARDENAPDAVIRLLETLPADETWRAVEEVWERAGGPSEGGA